MPKFLNPGLHGAKWLGLGALLLSFNILAGTEVLMSVNDNPQAADKSNKAADAHSTFAIQQGKIRLEPNATNKGSEQMMIYDSANDSMTIINHKEKSYVVVDSQGLAQMSAQLAAVKQQMDAQLAKLPPEQREMMLKMMPGSMSKAMTEQAPPPKTLQKTGTTENVAGYQCEITDVLTAGVKTREMCVTAWSELNASKDVSTTMVAMMGFFNRMMKTLSQSLPLAEEMPFAELETLGGLPIRIKAFDGNNVRESSQLVSIKDKDYPAEYFAIPQGYKKREIMPQH